MWSKTLGIGAFFQGPILVIFNLAQFGQTSNIAEPVCWESRQKDFPVAGLGLNHGKPRGFRPLYGPSVLFLQFLTFWSCCCCCWLLAAGCCCCWLLLLLLAFHLPRVNTMENQGDLDDYTGLLFFFDHFWLLAAAAAAAGCCCCCCWLLLLLLLLMLLPNTRSHESCT